MKVPLLDLRREWEEIEGEVREGWDRVLSTMRLLNGENVELFEREMAEYLGCRYVLGVASGTDALMLSLIACGVGEGDEVLVQANAFAADVEAIKWVGAVPVPVDITEDYGPDFDAIDEVISPKTRAFLVVHMYGRPVDMDRVMEVCTRHNLILIEDASHAHGAMFKGKKVGTFGKAGAFSCGVVKNLGALGDAGFVATDDPEVAHKVKYLRVHGQVTKNDHKFYGFNSRLDELQAVVLRVKLRRLDEKNRMRREIAVRYREAFRDVDGLIPFPPDDNLRFTVYHRYVVRTPKRDELREFLKGRGIGTGIHYPLPIHRQEAWRLEGYPSRSLPVSERICDEILSIPLFPEMREDEVDYVIESVREFFGG